MNDPLLPADGIRAREGNVERRRHTAAALEVDLGRPGLHLGEREGGGWLNDGLAEGVGGRRALPIRAPVPPPQLARTPVEELNGRVGVIRGRNVISRPTNRRPPNQENDACWVERLFVGLRIPSRPRI